MTDVVPSSGSSDVVPYDPREYGNIGLEDVSASDITIPRIKVVHAEGLFLNNLTNEKFDKLHVVLLGLVKQRIMWHEEVEDDDLPQCKSPDFEHGFPNMSEKVKAEKRFPWGASNFEPTSAVPLEIAQIGEPGKPDFRPGYSSNGFPTLPCSSCIFQKWDQGAWKQPPCNEQHTYPLMYLTEAGDFLPALFTTQKTGIKPSRAYLNSFAQTNTPMFTVFTDITLDMATRGINKYSIPKFTRGGATDRNSWREYAERYRSIRKFIQAAPRQRETDAEDETTPTVDNENRPPAEATAEATPAAASAAPAAVTTDDDLPF